MKPPSERNALSIIADRLSEFTMDNCRIIMPELGNDQAPPDGVLICGPFTFVVEYKSAGTVPLVASAIRQLQKSIKIGGEDAIPLVAVPFMGDAGAGVCEEAGIGWLDLSGNARIFALGLHVRVEGKPNLYKRRGRPSSAFAPKASRIARWLLIHPTEPVTQRKIAISVSLDEGYVSKVVGKLEEDGLILRDTDGAIMPKSPDLLLNAWLDDYDFSKHHIIRGHVAARSGDRLLGRLANTLYQSGISYASTGLAAAWLLDGFAGFRTVSIYIAREPSSELLKQLSFREEERGANVWLVVPNDLGIFDGSGYYEKVCCVHPVQAYLDLQAHPERSREASENLRKNLLNWRETG